MATQTAYDAGTEAAFPLHWTSPAQSSQATMAKYKLEYIWLDGYTPTPNLRSKTTDRRFASLPKLAELPDVGLRRQLDAAGRRPQLRLHAEAGRDLSRLHPQERRPRDVRSHDAGRQDARIRPIPAPPFRTTPGTWFGFEQEYFLYEDGRPLGFPAERLSRARRVRTTPASATRTSAASPARSSRSTSTSASTPASTSKASTPKWPRASGNSRSSARAPRRRRRPGLGRPLPAGAPLREVRHRRRMALQADPGGDWNGSGMHSNFSTTYVREKGGKAYFEKLMAAFDKHTDEHIAVYGPDNHLRSHRPPRNAVDRQVQLRRRRPRRVDPHPAQLRQQRLQGLPRRPPSELARAIRTRSPAGSSRRSRRSPSTDPVRLHRRCHSENAAHGGAAFFRWCRRPGMPIIVPSEAPASDLNLQRDNRL